MVITSNPTLSLYSPAKLNLFLHITGKRADGYHNLQTVFRLLDWGDTLDFYVTNQTFDIDKPFNSSNLPVLLKSNLQLTNNDLDNLVVKAAITLLNWIKRPENISKSNNYPARFPIIEIELNKVLPTGAGLGGGSSNAATTLKALNKIWKLNLDPTVLISIGACIGADVPIFLFGKDAIAEGVGEKLIAIDLPKQHYLLLNPSLNNANAHASTKALFSHPKLCRSIPSLDTKIIADRKNDYLNSLQAPFCNVFEPVVTNLVPHSKQALDYLRILETVTHSTARMTGSGSSVFLPFSPDHTEEIKNYINRFLPPCHAILTASYHSSE